MKYKYISTKQPTQGTLVYSRDEHSFDTEDQPVVSEPVASVAIAETLQIEFGVNSGTLLHIWGYSPQQAWRKAEVIPPSSKPGKVTIIDDQREEFSAGFSYDEPRLKNEKVLFDEKSGWILIGLPDVTSVIEVSKGTILGFREDDLACIWLHPAFED